MDIHLFRRANPDGHSYTIFSWNWEQNRKKIKLILKYQNLYSDIQRYNKGMWRNLNWYESHFDISHTRTAAVGATPKYWCKIYIYIYVHIKEKSYWNNTKKSIRVIIETDFIGIEFQNEKYWQTIMMSWYWM